MPQRLVHARRWLWRGPGGGGTESPHVSASPAARSARRPGCSRRPDLPPHRAARGGDQEAILESLRQWIQAGPELGRHGGTRRIRWPGRVHSQRQRQGHFLHRTERVANVARLQIPLDYCPELWDDRRALKCLRAAYSGARRDGCGERPWCWVICSEGPSPETAAAPCAELRSEGQVGARSIAELTKRTRLGGDVLSAGNVRRTAGAGEGGQQESRRPDESVRRRQHMPLSPSVASGCARRARRAQMRAAGERADGRRSPRACAATSTRRDAAGGLA